MGCGRGGGKHACWPVWNEGPAEGAGALAAWCGTPRMTGQKLYMNSQRTQVDASSTV